MFFQQRYQLLEFPSNNNNIVISTRSWMLSDLYVYSTFYKYENQITAQISFFLRIVHAALDSSPNPHTYPKELRISLPLNSFFY